MCCESVLSNINSSLSLYCLFASLIDLWSLYLLALYMLLATESLWFILLTLNAAVRALRMVRISPSTKGFCLGESQVELREHIDNLATELCRINEHQKVVLDLDPYVKKLLNARRRVVLVNNILQNAQERLRRLNHNVAKETVRRKTMLETSGAFTPQSPSKP
uniref:Biogenesis of lysosome-related organelles complex 1 subunit 7 n=1 Tax=Oncorhynchus tshawytscha TaxID=74940 RepID=A0AAZ3NNT8_ONCTS